jgi:hypothetical protein
MVSEAPYDIPALDLNKLTINAGNVPLGRGRIHEFELI